MHQVKTMLKTSSLLLLRLSKSCLRARQAFTLVELLLYLGLVGMMLLVVSLFLLLILQSRIKTQAIVEVEQQGIQVLERISQTARNAEAVNSPALGVSDSSLSLDVTDPTKDPTVFDLVSGVIRIGSEGTGPAVNLTNSRVTAFNLVFQNLSRPNTPGVVRIQFTLTHVNPANRSEYDYSKTFYATTSLR